MRVALYVRVSTKEQAEEGYSIGAQLEKMRLYCRSKEWIIVDEYVDPGESGGDMNRPALQKLIADCSNNIFDMILVYKLDRLSRSQKDTLYLIEEVFKKNHIDFTSMQENFDTSTPLGMAMVGILSVFAQLERSQIQERMALGREARAESGFYHGGGRVAIGYDYDPNTNSLIINEEEAQHVKMIFQMFREGNSINQIKNYMHKHYTSKYGTYNNGRTIHSILTNPTYTGKIRHGDRIFEGQHEAIIDQEYFDEIQKMYKIHCENSPKPAAAPFSRTTLLGGLIYCGKCGARYGGQVNSIKKGNCHKKYPIYSCYSRRGNKAMAKSDKCDNRNWKRAELEEIIWNEILKLDVEIENETSPLIDMIDDSDQIIKKIDQIDIQISRLMDLYSIDSMPVEMIGKKIKTLNDEKNELLNELDIAEEKSVAMDEVIEELKTAEDVKEKGTLEEQRALIEYLIQKIVIDDDSITIRWRFI
jgi:site-specific DNA recombinase